MKPGDDEANALRRARECSELIRSDPAMLALWHEIASRCEFVPDAESAFETIAGTVAGLHLALPKEAAAERLNRRRRFERAISKFRAEIETYQRQSGDCLPKLNDVIDRLSMPDIQAADFWRRLPTLCAADYLAVLEDHVESAAGGTWIHPMLATPSGRWPSTPNSAAVVWIIRAMDMAGVPRTNDRERNVFLRLAVRLSEVFQASGPPCDITPNRKDFENHPEFAGQGAQQWRR